MEIPPELAKEMVRLDAKVRWWYTSPTYKENDFGKVVVDNEKPAKTFCEVIDNTTKTSYVIATGITDEDALRNALKEAASSEKPKTKAQLSEAEATTAKAEVVTRDQEIATLKAELAELRKLVQPAGAGAGRGRGRMAEAEQV